MQIELKCELCGEIIVSEEKENKGAAKASCSLKMKKHLLEVHNLTVEEYILKTFYNGKYPTCACGCGTVLTFKRKDCFFRPGYGFGKYCDCSHVSRNPHKIKDPSKFVSKYDTLEYLENHYEKIFGLDNIKNALSDFLSCTTSLDEISKKYYIDKRTLKNAWYKLNLITEEEYNKQIKITQFKVSNQRKKKHFINADEICLELYTILEAEPNVYTIHSLIKKYNDEHVQQIDVSVHNVLSTMQQKYGNIYDKLVFGSHSKEELEFINILKYYFGKKKVITGKRLQFGNTKKESYIYDCCIDNKLIIEYDGSGFWHPIERKDYDITKENFAKNKGYLFMRISDKGAKNPNTIIQIKQILNDKDLC